MTRYTGPDDLVQAVRIEGVLDARIIQAVRRTPRAGFVPAGLVAFAYDDKPLPIAHDQVTTQPSLSARMIEGLLLTGHEHVLEVGTGLGFQTALLAQLCGDVVTIDRWTDMVEAARDNVTRHGIRNVEFLVGDGSGGVPERAPFDAVLVSAAFPEVPQPLVDQLRLGGHLVQPLGPGGNEEVVSFQRTHSGLERVQMLTLARFVRLRGQYGFPE